MTETKKHTGRPKVYATEEERIQARRDRANARYAAKSAEEKEALSQKAKDYRAAHPEKVVEYRAATYASHRERYEQDPEYRKRWNQRQKELRQARAEKAAKEENHD